jgi:hypothetical protein
VHDLQRDLADVSPSPLLAVLQAADVITAALAADVVA